MLRHSEDRLDYGKILTPPIDYFCEFAIGTTYSLDLDTLLTVPLSLFLREEMEESLFDNPVLVLEGLRQSSNKFLLFCEAGQIKVPNKVNPVYTMLEGTVFEVALNNGKSFHPKVWIVKYKNNDGAAFYRTIVLSRNLTFDRSWDVAVTLDGKLTRKKTTKNNPLIDFLGFLQPYTLNIKKRNQIVKMMNELQYVHFDTGNSNYTDYDFLPLGIGGGYDKSSTGLFEHYHDLLVMSPFLGKCVVDQFNGHSLTNASKTLITRRSEIPKLTNALLAEIDTYCLKDTILDGEEAISEPGGKEAQRQDIHAKLYFRRKYNEFMLYLGSANCSTNAFEMNGNIEFLLRLKYEKRGFRMSHVVDELFCRVGEDDDDRRNPFERIDMIPEDIKHETRVEDLLQRSIKDLCLAHSKALVTENEGAFDVTLSLETNKILEGVEMSIASLGGGVQQPLHANVVLKQLSLLQLSHFYIVRAKLNDCTVERVIKISTEGIPEDRDGAVLRSIIRDKATFLQYVAFLLADQYLLAALEQMEQKFAGSADFNLRAYEMPVLYENMLKTAARSPEKLEDIQEVIQRINDATIVPPAFDKLYQTFREATHKRGRT